MERNDNIVNKRRIVSCQSTLFEKLTSMNIEAVCLRLETIADFVRIFENVSAVCRKVIVDDTERAGLYSDKWSCQWGCQRSSETSNGYDLNYLN